MSKRFAKLGFPPYWWLDSRIFETEAAALAWRHAHGVPDLPVAIDVNTTFIGDPSFRSEVDVAMYLVDNHSASSSPEDREVLDTAMDMLPEKAFRPRYKAEP